MEDQNSIRGGWKAEAVSGKGWKAGTVSGEGWEAEVDSMELVAMGLRIGEGLGGAT